MNILLLNYEFPPMGGGASVATFNIAKHLVELGHHVDILTSKINGQKSKENIGGVTVYRVTSFRNSIHDCGMFGAFSFLFFAVFRFILLTRKNKYDWLTYFFSLPTAALSLLPGKHRKIPYIVSLRGSDVPMYDPYNNMLQLFHKMLMPFTKYIWRHARKVIALSSSLKETALKTCPDIEIDIIPNGIEIEVFQPCKQFMPNANKINIITVTRLVERKGVQHILRALAELRKGNFKIKNISLLIVGTGNYEYQLKTLCKQLYLNDVVTFYGFCPRSKLPRLYGQSNIFILPSLAESFGIVFAEAMACALPIISTNTGAIPDLVKDKHGVLVEPGNVNELKEAIKYMLVNKEKWHAMGCASRDMICKKYSWKAVAQRYSYIYCINQVSSTFENKFVDERVPMISRAA